MKGLVTSVVLGLEDRAYVEFASGLLGLSRSQFLRDSAVANAIVTIRGQGRLDEFVGFLEGFRVRHGVVEKKNVEVIGNDEDDKRVGDLDFGDREQPDIA